MIKNNWQFPRTHYQIFSLSYELITSLVILFLTGFFVAAIAGDLPSALLGILVVVLPILTLFTYYVVCWTRGGQSLAQKSWGLKVISIDGQPLSVVTSCMRALLASIFNISGLSLVSLLVSRNKQLLHDQLLGTKVIVYANH